MKLSLTSRVALITGAGSGIGRDFARTLAASGAAVACMGRRAEALEETVHGLCHKGFDAIAIRGDVASDDDVQRAVHTAVDWKGKIDILVNNAGVYPPGLIATLSEKTWLSTIDTNLTGSFRCIRHVAKVMAENKYGRIINVTSPSSLRGAFGLSAYAASKAGLNSLTQSAAAEFGSRGITVNAILMGVVATDSFVTSYSQATVDTLSARLAVKRAGTADDAAGLLVLLSSEASSYITGAIIPVDGGMTTVMPLT